MKWQPLFANLTRRRCLIVGGGQVALNKARLLAGMAAIPDVIAPQLEPELEGLVVAAGGQIFKQVYATADVDLTVYALVVAATSDRAVNATVADDATQQRVWVNVVDQPTLCDVIFPSIIDRSPFTLALSSAGKAPVLLRQWREKLEAMLPSRLGELVTFASERRDRVKLALSNQKVRRRFWEAFFDGPAASALLVGQEKQARQLFEDALAEPSRLQGEVYLVGAGPGNPDLLTLSALRLMQKADIVLYDNLVSDAVLTLCRRDAERLYVGKKRDYKILRQEEITALLIDKAKQGLRVLRLKGGDPFVFGRGGEEIGGLAQQQIPFQVVPGITAANGCAAYAGIPLTHRDYAQSVRFITGHLKENKMHLDWPELAKPDQTLVFYMGRKNLPYLTLMLLKKGRSPDTAIAVVENGTLPNQRVLISTLGQVADLLAATELTGPTVAIIGDVVKLRAALGYDDK